MLGTMVTASAKSQPAASEVRRQTRVFLQKIDVLSELLTPPRRPEDNYEPECSRTELRILGALARRQPIAMTDLAGSLDLPLSTTTRAVDKLVVKGLAERRRIANDRRIVQVGFSKRGEEINRFVTKSRIATARRILKRLNDTERNDWIDGLGKVVDAAI